MDIVTAMLESGTSTSPASMADLLWLVRSHSGTTHWTDLFLACSGVPAWKRAVELPLASDEQISLITHIFSDRDEIEVVEHLYGDDAQTFVDVMNKVVPCSPVPEEWTQ